MNKKLFSLFIMISMALHASTPTVGDILRQVEPIKLPTSDKALPSVGAEDYKAPMEDKDTIKIFVKSFKFNGNTVFTSETLSELVKSYEEKELGINGLKEVARLITKYYRDHGFFVARAYIPAQAMEKGIIEIAIVEGNYGTFDIQNTSLVNTEEIQGFMDYLKMEQKVSIMSLEHQMLLINDLAGSQVTNAELYPGIIVGTSDFRITIDPTPKYSSYAMVDNYGSRYTGENRLSVGSTINSLSGIGDNLSFTGMLSNTTDLKNARLGYERPFGYNGLKGGTSISMTSYQLSSIDNYNGYGHANTMNAYLSYVFLKSRAHTMSTDLIYDHKNLKDNSGVIGLVEEGRKQVDVLTLRVNDKLNTTLLNLPGSLDTSVGIVTGHLGLKNDVARQQDSHLNAEGNYVKATLAISHNQYLNELFSIKTTCKAQKSFSKNLDTSEDISVGGSNGVRAYEDSELSGDQGYILSIDVVHPLPNIDSIHHNTSLFIDHAKVWENSSTFNTEDNVRILNAIGLGYTLNYKAFDLKATFAHGFGNEATPTTEANFTTSTNKVLIQMMMRF